MTIGLGSDSEVRDGSNVVNVGLALGRGVDDELEGIFRYHALARACAGVRDEVPSVVEEAVEVVAD
jgi:hypothetical protein